MGMRNAALSLLIPYFEKHETCVTLFEQLERIQAALAQDGKEIEIWIGDDGSSPASAEILRQTAAKYLGRVRNLQLKRRDKNCGKGFTLIEGAALAQAPVLLWLDADAAFGTEDVLAVAREALQHPNSIVVADRSQATSPTQSFLRAFFSRGFSWLARSLLALPLRDVQAGLKSFPRDWFCAKSWSSHRFGLDIETLREARKEGLSFRSVLVRTVSYEGSSTVKPWQTALSLSRELFRPLLNGAFGLGMLAVFLANLRAFSPRSSVPWDARDEMWFYFRWLGATLRAGHWGDWIPNVVAGYPVAANIQAGAYNPVYLFFAVAFPDTVLSINLLYLFFQLSLFVVFYLIGLTYRLRSPAACFLGLSMVASGFVVGHASHFSYLSSLLGVAAVFLGLRYASRHHGGLAALLAFLGVAHAGTSGYPAILLFAAQVLALAAVFVSITQRSARRALGAWFLGASIGALLAVPALWHFANQVFHSARGEGLKVEQVLAGSLSPRALLNLLWPWMQIAPGSPGYVDLTMDRFHLLFLSLPLITFALWCVSPHQRRFVYATLGTGLLFTLLALGSHSPIPLRAWLAEHFFLYRVGRFPSGEHRAFALFCLSLVSAFGFDQLWGQLRRASFKTVLAVFVLLDFASVGGFLGTLRYQRLSPDLLPPIPRFQVEYGTGDQAKIDHPRGCPFDERLWVDQQKAVPDRFTWNGYTNMWPALYERDRESLRWALCGPSRLWVQETQAAQPYSLESYSPSRIRLRVRGVGTQTLLWAETQDGFWELFIDGRKDGWHSGPGALRYFQLPDDKEHRVEMLYRGPLSRLWRRPSDSAP